jgi:hypothetical protein
VGRCGRPSTAARRTPASEEDRSAWAGRGRPPIGCFTTRAAEAWLRDALDQARRGTLPGVVRTAPPSPTRRPSTCGATPSTTAAASRRRCATTARRSRRTRCRPSDRCASRTSLRRRSSGGAPGFLRRCRRDRRTSAPHPAPRDFRRAQRTYGLAMNPMVGIERDRQRSSGHIQVFGVDEVLAPVRAAASEQDAAIFMSAAFTGLRRGELLALRRRDVDFALSAIRIRASYAGGAPTMPRSGRVRRRDRGPGPGQLSQRPVAHAPGPRAGLLGLPRGRARVRADVPVPR